MRPATATLRRARQERVRPSEYPASVAFARLQRAGRQRDRRTAIGRRRSAAASLRQVFTDSQIRNALRLIEGGEPAIQAARDLGVSGAALYRRIRELPQATTI